MITLAIDPGVKHCGVAIFDGTTLTGAYLLAPCEVSLSLVRPDRVFIEVPQVYRASHSKGDPNDLIAVALIVGRLLERFGEARLIKPREWKGQIPKVKHHAREIKKLSTKELSVIPSLPKSLLHNVLDAIFLGKKMLDACPSKR